MDSGFMAQRTTLVADRPAKSAKALKKNGKNGEDRERILEAFRRWGYLQANLDPLGLFKPLKYAELDALAGPAADEAREIYCGTIGAEFMHLPEPERRRWIAERIETPAPEVDQHKILERLMRADLFRAGSAGALSGHQAIFARRRHRADSAARCDP